MKFTSKQFIYGTLVVALISGMTACDSADSTDRTNDSLTRASVTAAAVDSVATAKAKKKKKGQTSVSGFKVDSAKMVKDARGVYNRAEKAPEFPGGEAALASYINTNLTYPTAAVENGTNGTVHVTFIVDEHGKVVNPQVTDANRLGDGLADETLVVFNKMPLWKPGTVHGKKVKTRLELPVKFELADADQ